MGSRVLNTGYSSPCSIRNTSAQASLVSLLWPLYVIGGQGVSQTAALNRGRHLYSAGRPSRWALAHISSFVLDLLSTRIVSSLLCVGPVISFYERLTVCSYRSDNDSCCAYWRTCNSCK